MIDKIYPYAYYDFLYKKFKNWDPNRYDWNFESWKLAVYCNKYFEIWWDDNKFNWNHKNHLIDCCSKYKHIWERDYIIWKLEQ